MVMAATVPNRLRGHCPVPATSKDANRALAAISASPAVQCSSAKAIAGPVPLDQMVYSGNCSSSQTACSNVTPSR